MKFSISNAVLHNSFALHNVSAKQLFYVTKTAVIRLKLFYNLLLIAKQTFKNVIGVNYLTGHLMEGLSAHCNYHKRFRNSWKC